LKLRYIRYQTSVSKVFDGVIADISEKRDILSAIHDRELTCKLQLKDGPIYENVRITKVDNDNFSWRMIKNKSILQQNSKIDDIRELEVNSDLEVGIQLKPQPSRWTVLDSSTNLDQ
jgi:hypothetical protein